MWGQPPSAVQRPGSIGPQRRSHAPNPRLPQANRRPTYADLIRQKFPTIPRRVSGYNLNYLLPENGFHIARALVGSEGTCATVLEATCRLVESPPERVLLVVAYPDIFQCADHIPEILEHKPIGLEGFDDLLVYYTRTKGINPEGLALLPEGGGWLMVEFGGQTIAEAESQARGLIDALNRSATPPNIAPLLRPASQAHLGNSRSQPRRHLARPRRAAQLGRLGRRRRRSRKTRRLSPRPPQDDGRLRLQRLALRTLRPRLRPHAPQLRPAIERRHRQVPQLRRRSRRPRRQLRRIALRRTRRRTSPRRTPPQNVRPRTDAGLPRIQVRLGSRLEDESRQADRSAWNDAQQARRKSPPRRELRSRGSPQPASSFPPITAASRTPRCAASASANAAAKKAA